MTLQYELLRGSTESELSSEVNSYLAKGWGLYGDPSCAISVNESGLYLLFSQAVVKENSVPLTKGIEKRPQPTSTNEADF